MSPAWEGIRMNKKIVIVWGLVFLVMVGYLMFIQSDLPDRLAVHFDINGNPNGFQDKDVFITTFLCFIFFYERRVCRFFFGNQFDADRDD